jgi:hypothetical protein
MSDIPMQQGGLGTSRLLRPPPPTSVLALKTIMSWNIGYFAGLPEAFYDVGNPCR